MKEFTASLPSHAPNDRIDSWKDLIRPFIHADDYSFERCNIVAHVLILDRFEETHDIATMSLTQRWEAFSLLKDLLGHILGMHPWLFPRELDGVLDLVLVITLATDRDLRNMYTATSRSFQYLRQLKELLDEEESTP